VRYLSIEVDDALANSRTGRRLIHRAERNCSAPCLNIEPSASTRRRAGRRGGSEKKVGNRAGLSALRHTGTQLLFCLIRHALVSKGPRQESWSFGRRPLGSKTWTRCGGRALHRHRTEVVVPPRSHRPRSSARECQLFLRHSAAGRSPRTAPPFLAPASRTRNTPCPRISHDAPSDLQLGHRGQHAPHLRCRLIASAGRAGTTRQGGRSLELVKDFDKQATPETRRAAAAPRYSTRELETQGARSLASFRKTATVRVNPQVVEHRSLRASSSARRQLDWQKYLLANEPLLVARKASGPRMPHLIRPAPRGSCQKARRPVGDHLRVARLIL
jgi:hypothetical protein